MLKERKKSEHIEETFGRGSGSPERGPRLLEESRQPTSYPTGKRKEGEILTVEETAEYLRVRASTVYSWVENSLIPHIKMGRLVRFRKSDIDEWLNLKRSEPENNRRIRIGSKSCGNPDIDRLVKKAIDSETGIRYKTNQGKSDRIKGLGEEVEHGNL